jgi:glycosyltransferase involved in cell wall biosynthesis
MIEGRDIVCQSFVTWDDHWGTPQQQMSRFAARNRIFFIDQPISPLSLLTGIRSRSAVMRQFRRWRQGPRKVADNVWAGAPPLILPVRNTKLINRINAWIMRRWLAGQVKKLGFHDTIYWNFQPQSPGLASAVKPVLSVFHCVDDFSAIPHWWNLTTASMTREAESCREADVVICTGRKLTESRRTFNNSIHFVPEGADVTLFFTASAPETAVPAGMAALPGKVVGYIGVVDFRLDAELLTYIARQRPDWSLAIVGPVKSDTNDMTALRALPNVHFFDRQPLDALPSFLKRMDACLIPYVLNDYTHHIFPLKLYEYMAAGKPIVASDMEEMRPYAGDEMAIAKTPAEWVAAINDAITHDSPDRVLARQEAARSESWDHRVEQVSAIIEPMLRERRRTSTSPTSTTLLAGNE